jgi:hypothetical protein
MDAAALKEAMLDHAVAKQQEEDCQEERKKKLSGSERGLRSRRRCRIRISCHLGYLVAKSGRCGYFRHSMIRYFSVAVQIYRCPFYLFTSGGATILIESFAGRVWPSLDLRE